MRSRKDASRGICAMADNITVSGDNLVVKDKSGNQVYPASNPNPPDPNPPTTAPVLAITSPGGSVSNTQQVTVSGTIDLPNVGVDIHVHSVVNPTDFGTCRANAQGAWSKQIMMTSTGSWDIQATA